MSLITLLAEQRRLSVLLALSEDDDRRLGEGVLRRWVAAQVDDVDRDQFRADLSWLEQSGLVTLVKPSPEAAGAPWMVRQTELGERVAGGRRFPGVAATLA